MTEHLDRDWSDIGVDIEMVLKVLEEKKEELSAVEAVEGGDGAKLDLILTRESFGGGTRRERYVEIRNVNSGTINFHSAERPAMFLSYDGLLLNGVYINGKLVGDEGDFQTLLDAALASPFVRIVEPEAPK